MKTEISLTFLIILFGLLPQASSAEEKSSFIHLKQIDGRTWLVDSQGKPFFAHGITHINGIRGFDFNTVGKTFKELGFNAYGYGCPEKLKSDMPFFQGRNFVPISMYRTSDGSFQFVDIFDPKVQAKYEQQVANVCFANRNNPNLIGYFWTDLAAWPLKNWTGKNWVEFIRSLPEEAPGKKKYNRFLKTTKTPKGAKQDLEFLRLIAREYFRVFGEANRKFDPDHLVFGDRLTPQTAIPEVLEEMIPYVDGIAIQPNYQPGFPKKEFDRIHKISGKPIVICDFAIRFKDGDKKIRGWKPQESPKIAGEHYAKYIRDAFSTSYVIGAFWCNPIDSKPGFKKAGIKQGLFGQGFQSRPELNDEILKLNQFLAEKTPSKLD